MKTKWAHENWANYPSKAQSSVFMMYKLCLSIPISFMEACCWRNIACFRPPPAKSLSLLRAAASASASASAGGIHPSSSSSVRTAMSGGGDRRRRRRAYDGLLLDAGGTLLQLASPVEETYATIGKKYGLSVSENEIKQRFRRAFSAPWPKKLRYQGDGREFWRLVVSEATGCARDDYFEEVYEHFAHGDAWRLPVGAHETMSLLKEAEVKMAVVSNFDNRLRMLLKDLNVAHLFDAIIISSEVGYEKPAAEIFKSALDQIGVEAGKAVHIGDDEKADRGGANAVGIGCWLWGSDVKTFAEIYDRVLSADQ